MIRVITMLTKDDMTISNAISVFDSNKQAKTPCWGFKDVNISFDEAEKLGAKIRSSGKEFFLESLVNNVEDGIKVAKLALKLQPDYLISMEYYPEVHAMLKDTNIKLMPTCGRRAGSPRRMLYGSIQEIIDDANRIADKGVAGITLSVFRYVDGDPIELTSRFVKAVKVPLIVSGSINSEERLDFIKKVNPWGFTCGTALFDDSFGSNRTIAEKLDYIGDYLQK